MPFYQVDEIRYFSFDSLSERGVKNAFFTRRGGISPQPWASLNVGGTVGDDPSRVQENRRRSFQALGRAFESLFDVWQVHGAEVVCTDAPRPSGEKHQQADVILTDQPGVTLFMRFADCVPILLFDPVRRAIGLAHAGWKGTVLRTAAAAVAGMERRYGTRPRDILAAIGPSIGPHHYEIGAEVSRKVFETFGQAAAGLLPPVLDGNDGCGTHFDLWAANRLILEQAGVREIEMANICTACTLEDWYSHRGELGQTGRFGALIGF